MKTLLSALSLIFLASAAQAEVINIVQKGMTFSPSSVVAHPGDTIIWTHGGGTHTVVNGFPCNAAENPLFNMPLNSSNPTAEWVVPQAISGKVPYFCDVYAHCASGMHAEIIIEPEEGFVIIDISQSGLFFDPPEIEVSPGDIVRWTWNNGGHSASSATQDTCSEDNIYFNLPLDQDYPVALWVVPENMPDVIEYICIYHCEMGHRAMITRKADKILGDLNNDGTVNGADLSILLGGWGNSSGDVNGDGTTDGADLATLLGNWTS